MMLGMKSPVHKRSYLFFLISLLCFGTASALFSGVLDNYLAIELSASKAERGVIEFFREMPGLFLFLTLALFYRVSERRIFQVGYAIAMVGVLGFLLVGPRMIPAIFMLTVYSTGQHLIMPVRQSYAVHSAGRGKEGAALGLMRSVQSIGQVIGFFIVPLIFLAASGSMGFTYTFIGVIILILCAILASLFLERDTGTVTRQRIYFRKKYTTYYILQNFYGARKQVFMTFAPYVLILNYGASTSVIAMLMGVCAALNIVVSPLIGKLIDRAGYKAVMVGDTVILFFVCLLYGFAHRLFPISVAYIVVAVVYVIDHLVSNASMAASVYVRHLSDDRDEMTATLTTGISLDHLISIFIALAGGLIWEFLGIELLFILAALLAVMNSLIALTIKPQKLSAAAL
ncbi:MAG: MFS transporter [Spirochaetia bacterium]|nr:MFS transporter [Spirochaetia bacterium]